MKLYHGTTESVARKALTEGLKPRSMLTENGNGNWEHTVESNPNAVYLTDTYAPYFAFNATKDVSKEKWAVIEVDVDLLDEENMLPDEDWLEQGTRGDPDWDYTGNTMEERTRWFRDHAILFSHVWRDSVKSMGNCCHRGIIPPAAITRVGIFDPRKKASITMLAMDPSITPLNHFLCGRKYRALTRWLVGDDVDVMDFYRFGEDGEDCDIDIHPMMQANVDHLKGELDDRTCQEILVNDLELKWLQWKSNNQWTKKAHAVNGKGKTFCGRKIPRGNQRAVTEPKNKCKRCERKVE